ncbi:MAG: peptide chain release factor N(5)-glutamine methyltransferase [Roseburia sp.]|nr:peptide chain release factor N(5)-glutamine methyltransferase [Roseburia sp.]MDY5882199.1 peptide chain release factor N(5)-glutamine methyltransferase [Roseburia sp.]
MTYQEAVKNGEKVLNLAGIADAKVDAWLLFEMACKVDRQFYYLHMGEDITMEQQKEYEIALKKRTEHIPLQYIVGEQEFMGLKFKVNSSVLIPRQDTETLVEEALKKIQPDMKVLDMCTGSGCIIISIIKNVPSAEGYAVDISKQALNVAKENAKSNEVPVNFERSDLFDNVTGVYDVIVSNPPYIPTAEIPKLMPEVGSFEPLEALDGKEDGLFFYRKIVAECGSHLKDGGYLLFEIGCEQANDVTTMLRETGFYEVQVVKDLAGLDRVVIGRK